jgi:hypothetical protein
MLRITALIGAVVLSVAAGAAARAAAPPVLTVPCAEIAGPVKSPRVDGYRVLLGQVSVPPAYLPQVVRVHGDEPWTFWSKAGLVVRSGRLPVLVTVPKAWRSRVAITWGNRPGILSAIRIAACPSLLSPWGWHGYAGGFYLRSRSACVPLTFRVGSRSATVRFGIGRRCAA